MNTLKLFNEDAYSKDFKATVVNIIGENKVVLDETYFYPEAGGQPFDTGRIGNSNVINTQIDKETSEIFHTVDVSTPLTIGEKISCSIDWDKRYKYMRLHSALHVLYLAFTSKYGECKLRGATIEEEKARLDVEYFDAIDLDLITQKTNDIISLDLDITTYADPNKKNYRYWKMGDFPEIPCGGTHVKNTSEIGNATCKIKNKGKQGQRIYITIQK